MKAFITSIGEPTTELCKWSLERNGFDVYVISQNSTTLNISSLAQKLKYIYAMADDDFIRVDGDVIPNKNLTLEKVNASCPSDAWWVQYMTFDWYKQDLTHGGVQYIKKEALPILRENIGKFMESERPESQMYRLEEFHNPRKCITSSLLMGVHGYGQNDIERVKATKTRRMQSYDWDLFDRIQAL